MMMANDDDVLYSCLINRAGLRICLASIVVVAFARVLVFLTIVSPPLLENRIFSFYG